MFDEQLCYLGPLCKHGHDWAQSGRSLRLRASKKCRECARLSRARQPWVALDRSGLAALVVGGEGRLYLERKLRGHVERRGTQDCWLWTGRRNDAGYGVITITFGGRSCLICAHQLAYLLDRGSLPEPPLLIRHALCGERACCNPAHLAAGTYRDNADDTMRMRRYRRGDQHWTHQQPDRLLCGEANPSRQHPERLARGEDHWAARLTEEKVAIIRSLLAQGVSQAVIARAFGVGKQTVNAIAIGRTWRDIVPTESA